MADVADHRVHQPRDRSRLAIDFDADRTVAFRRARRHSVLVRILRVMFPLTAIAMFASYGLFLQKSFKLSVGNGKVTGTLDVSTEALVARNPRYEGFDKQGGHFVVRAKTAEQDFGQKGPVRLKDIDGQMLDASKSATDLKAHSGTFDTKSNVLELFKQIEVKSQNGMVADLTRATVHSREGLITSGEPVTVRMPTGEVRGRTMVLEQKQRMITFDEGVTARFKQDNPKERTPEQKAASGGLGASDAPVDVTSVKLVVDDNAKTAVFTGNVVAKQADSTLTAARLEVGYEGQATPAGGAPGAATKQAKSSGPDVANASRLKRIVAKDDVVLPRGIERATSRTAEFDATTERAVLAGNVVMTSGTDRQATSERAELDQRNDQATLIGNVVVTQTKNVLRGRRMFLDRKAGTMAMSSPAEPGLGKGRVYARMYQAENEKTAAHAKASPILAAEPAKGMPLAMRADPSQPIDIESDTLDVNDRNKNAIFRGSVRAVQGEYTILTEELVAVYSGEASAALGPQAQQAQPAADPKAKGSGAQLQKVTAPKRVIVRTKDGRTASGNSAEFDMKANQIVLLGDVTLSQNSSVTTGPKAILDMATGTMQMEQAGAAAGPVAGHGPAVSASQPRQRVQILLYPNEIKEKNKVGATSQPAATSGAAPAAAKSGHDEGNAPAPAQRAASDRVRSVPPAPNAGTFPGMN